MRLAGDPDADARRTAATLIAALASGGGNDTHQLTAALDGGAAQALQELG